jgi:hypothetical protein
MKTEEIVVLSIISTVLLIIFTRPLVMWYYGVNEIIKELKEIKELLKNEETEK